MFSKKQQIQRIGIKETAKKLTIDRLMCGGGQGRRRTGWERFNTTHVHRLRASTREGETQKNRWAEIQKEQGTQTPATKDIDHC